MGAQRAACTLLRHGRLLETVRVCGRPRDSCGMPWGTDATPSLCHMAPEPQAGGGCCVPSLECVHTAGKRCSSPHRRFAEQATKSLMKCLGSRKESRASEAGSLGQSSLGSALLMSRRPNSEVVTYLLIRADPILRRPPVRVPLRPGGVVLTRARWPGGTSAS